MRILLIGAEGTGLGAALAEHLRVDHIQSLDQVHGDGFVLEGSPADVAEARRLDALLSSRAADVDVVLWLSGPVDRDTEAVLVHYRGRVAELSGPGFAEALDALRESLLV